MGKVTDDAKRTIGQTKEIVIEKKATRDACEKAKKASPAEQKALMRQAEKNRMKEEIKEIPKYTTAKDTLHNKKDGHKTISTTFFKYDKFCGMRQEYFDKKGKLVGYSSTSIVSENSDGTKLETKYFDTNYDCNNKAIMFMVKKIGPVAARCTLVKYTNIVAWQVFGRALGTLPVIGKFLTNVKPGPWSIISSVFTMSSELQPD